MHSVAIRSIMVFQFKVKYGKELRCPNTEGKYSIKILIFSIKSVVHLTNDSKYSFRQGAYFFQPKSSDTFLISPQKHILRVLIRSVSVRHF